MSNDKEEHLFYTVKAFALSGGIYLPSFNTLEEADTEARKLDSKEDWAVHHIVVSTEKAVKP